MFTEKYAGKMCRRYIHRILTSSRHASSYIGLYQNSSGGKREKKEGKREGLSVEGIRTKYDLGTAAVPYATLPDKSCVSISRVYMQIKTESQVQSFAVITYKIAFASHRCPRFARNAAAKTCFALQQQQQERRECIVLRRFALSGGKSFGGAAVKWNNFHRQGRCTR